MMTPERWQQIDALLLAALERAPAERASFLDEACRGDESLRIEVEAMLSSDDEALSLMDRPAFEMAAGLFDDGKPELSAGQNIGHHQILLMLGAGGMGEVYLAQDLKLGRKIAIKLLPVDLSFDEARLRRFQQEARAASALNHPNIITIHEIGEFEGRHFIATEFIEGRTLRQVLQHKRLSLPRALDIAIQAASALAAAHDAGIVHRDIKPENIMLRPDGLVKILDFGLAQLSNPQSSTSDTEALTLDRVVTTPGLLMGTVNYMSPEQARGQRLDTRTDIFSLGVVTYEMIAGRPPFEGETASDLIAAILKVEPPLLHDYLPDAPTDLQRVVAKALRKDREERYQTIKDLLVDLRGLKKDLERTTTPSAAATATANGAAISTDNRASTATAASGIRTLFSIEYLTSKLKHRKAAAAAIALVVLIAAAVIAIALLRHPGPKPPAAHFQNVNVTRITTMGNAHSPAISPDGQEVAFLSSDDGHENLWIQQVATGSRVQIGPIGKGLEYGGLTFSPDGTYLYFVGDGDESDLRPTVYRIPKFGGPVQKVIAGADSSFSLSSNGRSMAFLRNDSSVNNVIVANADGTGERQVASRHEPDFFWAVDPSPDGARVACAGMRRDSKDLGAIVTEIEVNSGAEKTITVQRWRWIEQVKWLHDESGLIIIAQEKEGSDLQLWFISYPDGEARRITTDLNNYSNLSLTPDSKTLVATQVSPVVNLWLVPDGDASRAERITSGPGRRDGMYGAAWTPDGKIVYSSSASGSVEIWMMEADGSNQRQLTSGSGQTHSLSVSPDGRYILYVADHNGNRGIWRLNIDGSNPKQLTEAGAAPHCSADGKWVFYQTMEGDKRFTWRVPIDGGQSERLTNLPPDTLGFSPDGKLAVYIHSQDQTKKRLAIIPSEGGEPVGFLDLPPSTYRIQWMPDGRSLSYVDQQNNNNLWIAPLDGGRPRQVTAFKSSGVLFYAWSFDGKRIAVSHREIINSDVVLINRVK
ncbi:MAG TPA: protein kinase [Blastocatellia bacterium]|nr:protein kinase [Blastocatellia bacterium]